MAFQIKSGLWTFALAALVWTSPCSGQAPQPTDQPSPEKKSGPQNTSGVQQPDQRSPGSISGTVVDQSGAIVVGALVKLTRDDASPASAQAPAPVQEMLSGSDGQFAFDNVAPGSFRLTITAAGFASQTSSGILRPGEIQTVPQIALEVATAVAEMEVGLSRVEVAQEQIKVEEKQRVLGVIPNFYVSYSPNPVPLSSRQKFEIAWKTVIDPVTFVLVGGIAGVEQAQNHFSGYGQGAEGYAKRYGAGYADAVSGTFIGAAILPSLLKQDPRYFYKGSGSKRSRFLYAVANSVICKGDNGHWQANYSNILGSLAAGGISNLYYPANDRNGAALTFENGAIGIGATAVANLFQEFVVRKFTPKLPNRDQPKP